MLADIWQFNLVNVRCVFLLNLVTRKIMIKVLFNDFIDLERRIFIFNKVIIKRNDLSIKHLIKLTLFENDLTDVPYRSICDMFEV